MRGSGLARFAPRGKCTKSSCVERCRNLRVAKPRITLARATKRCSGRLTPTSVEAEIHGEVGCKLCRSPYLAKPAWVSHRLCGALHSPGDVVHIKSREATLLCSSTVSLPRGSLVFERSS